MALARLESETVLPLDDQLLSASVAHILIRGERGENVTDQAAATLAALGDMDERCDELPDHISASVLKARLKVLASN